MNRNILILLAVLAGLGLALGLFWGHGTSLTPITCASAPRKLTTAAPASLTSARDYLTQGDYDYEHQDCDRALSDYTRAIALDPGLAEAYNNRAYVYMVQREYAAALADLDQALQIRPDYVNALMNRGDIYNYYYAIDYARAVADYDRVLRVDPAAPNGTSVCGHRLLALNHGWNVKVLAALAIYGPMAACRNAGS